LKTLAKEMLMRVNRPKIHNIEGMIEKKISGTLLV
jgi:hypothetical protein